MAEKNLLAIGGPKHGEWLPDSSMGKYVIAKPREVKFSELGRDPFSDDPLEMVIYTKDYLLDPATRNRRAIYRHSEMSTAQAYRSLKLWLVDVFINSEPDEE